MSSEHKFSDQISRTDRSKLLSAQNFLEQNSTKVARIGLAMLVLGVGAYTLTKTKKTEAQPRHAAVVTTRIPEPTPIPTPTSRDALELRTYAQEGKETPLPKLDSLISWLDPDGIHFGVVIQNSFTPPNQAELDRAGVYWIPKPVIVVDDLGNTPAVDLNADTERIYYSIDGLTMDVIDGISSQVKISIQDEQDSDKIKLSQAYGKALTARSIVEWSNKGMGPETIEILLSRISVTVEAQQQGDFLITTPDGLIVISTNDLGHLPSLLKRAAQWLARQQLRGANP